MASYVCSFKIFSDKFIGIVGVLMMNIDVKTEGLKGWIITIVDDDDKGPRVMQ